MMCKFWLKSDLPIELVRPWEQKRTLYHHRSDVGVVAQKNNEGGTSSHNHTAAARRLTLPGIRSVISLTQSSMPAAAKITWQD